VDRAIDNLVKSGKMFSGPGNRREWFPIPGPARKLPGPGKFAWDGPGQVFPLLRIQTTDSRLQEGRMSAGPGPRPHSGTDFGDARGPHQSTNLQNFYASQRHQSSRGSNEAEQIMQAKRRMAAQRERELRNYHQEQQYNRSRPPSTV